MIERESAQSLSALYGEVEEHAVLQDPVVAREFVAAGEAVEMTFHEPILRVVLSEYRPR